MTGDRLAKLVGVKRPYISKLESKEKDVLPSAEMLLKLQKALGCRFKDRRIKKKYPELVKQKIDTLDHYIPSETSVAETISTISLKVRKPIDADTREELEQHMEQIQKEQKEISKIIDRLSKEKK